MTLRTVSRISLVFTAVALAALACTDGIALAESQSRREQRREKVPVDKLIERLEAPANVQRKQFDRVIEVVGVKKGETVADVGAGTGQLSFRLARTVASEGKVYSVEIEDALLDYIREKMVKTNVTNLVPVKSSDTGPNLPPNSCDKIFFVSSYEYLPDPVVFMTTARKAMKPGGVVIVIAIDGSKVQPKQKLILKDKLYTADELAKEMKRAGFKLRASYTLLEKKLFMVFDAA